MEDLLEEKYAAGETGFLSLVEMLTKGQKDQTLPELIKRTYESFQSMPHPERKLERAADLYVNIPEEVSETVWVSYLLQKAQKTLTGYIKKYDIAISDIEGDLKLAKAYGPAFLDDRALLKSLMNVSGDHAELVTALDGISFMKLGALRGYEDTDFRDRLKALREEMKKAVQSIRDTLEETPEEICQELQKIAPAARELAELVKEYSRRFLEAKTKAGMLEFNDVSQYAHRLLWRTTPDGMDVPTTEALLVADRYDEVVVDEYQDTNSLQDEIFHAITGNGRNLIMVGDVKQSIYGFRYAEPEGFVDKLRRYAVHGTVERGHRKISLNRNYRSSGGVIDYINFVFTCLMKKEQGGIDYDQEQRLYLGREDGSYHKTEVIYLSERDSNLPKREYEAQVVALRIREMVEKGVAITDKGQDRPVRYGDFAILLRSAKNRMPIYEKALLRLGIPVTTSRAPGLYSTPEGEFVLSLLSVVDNPYNDVALLAVLTSPAFGFTPGELGRIRLQDKKASFIQALRQNGEAGDEKSRLAVAKIDRWRSARMELRLGLLIRQIYDDLSLPTLCLTGEDGEERLHNIYLIAGEAEHYESRGGLTSFLKAAARAVENNNEPDAAPHTDAGDSVHLLTIHQSKGLQYPVVALVDTTTPFNTRSLSDEAIYHKNMGFGFKIRDREKGIRYGTVTHKAVRQCAIEEQSAEELRIFYVALTRAQEKLLLFATYPDAEKSISDLAHTADLEDLMTASSCYADWFSAAGLFSREGSELLISMGVRPIDRSGEECAAEYTFYHPDEESPEQEQDREAEITRPEPLEIPEGLFERYRGEYAVNLPTKRTATEIKDTVKNPELFEKGDITYTPRPERKPAFLSGRGLSAAERGTAVHLALQLIRLDKTGTREGVEEELDRLLRGKYLTPEARKSISGDRLHRFFTSDLGKRLCGAEKVWRELKFTLLEDAGRFAPEAVGKGESVLLQGIVDCAFEEGGDLILIDYKSDYLGREDDPVCHARNRGYDKQLAVYAEALERIIGKPVKEGWIYFTARSQAELLLKR
ncbi:MAG: UvrD-helicase domain-containing protein, partial [Clostridia bacterium]|nr:UvrD-helicase domain-containing protein [Clostridia bacterium]